MAKFGAKAKCWEEMEFLAKATFLAKAEFWAMSKFWAVADFFGQNQEGEGQLIITKIIIQLQFLLQNYSVISIIEQSCSQVLHY